MKTPAKEGLRPWVLKAKGVDSGVARACQADQEANLSIAYDPQTERLTGRAPHPNLESEDRTGVPTREDGHALAPAHPPRLERPTAALPHLDRLSPKRKTIRSDASGRFHTCTGPGRSRPNQHRQDAPCRRAHACPRHGHDRPAAAPAGARDLRPDGEGKGPEGLRADHRRGTHPARDGALFRLHRRRRCRLARARTSSPSTRSSSRPIPTAATSSPTASCAPAGRHETMLLGADTMRPALQALDLDIDGERRERFSQLSYAGPIKITKLPKRSAVVAFSAEEVYAIAELLKRQRGGCAVIMGALSPRTRNAQVDLYQSGRSRLHRRHRRHRHGPQPRCRPHRLRLRAASSTAASAAICGPTNSPRSPAAPAASATTARSARPPSASSSRKKPSSASSTTISSRSTISTGATPTSTGRASPGLLASLRRPSPSVILRRAPEALDETTLAALAEDRGRDAKRVRSPAHVRRLWDLCTLPDFRKCGPDAHLKLVAALRRTS